MTWVERAARGATSPNLRVHSLRQAKEHISRIELLEVLPGIALKLVLGKAPDKERDIEIRVDGRTRGRRRSDPGMIDPRPRSHVLG